MATPGSSQVQTSHATAAVGTEEDKAVDVVNVSEGEEEENSDDGGWPSKRKLTSVVWNDFEKVRVDGVWKAKCNHCNKKLSATSRNVVQLELQPKWRRERYYFGSMENILKPLEFLTPSY
ncbi:hypothetical protein E2562_025462 [Oryza meyeriana var. granulata]|uniref:BED-type domain-containing protein n=1 Tax=Oryza meyeriana var. granulata TaxID=110450 RepID=A0A6G1D7W8_9ORYZ|nr:hypothetical protein E2562_025462 [Oryza meyeriana var. granulata]